ncbi:MULTISPECIES: YjcZ family sporulation protein [Salipaludibacillus]|nr:YjcZ family sporulation protein [Salipaludibacillus neizhouensis]
MSSVAPVPSTSGFTLIVVLFILLIIVGSAYVC